MHFLVECIEIPRSHSNSDFYYGSFFAGNGRSGHKTFNEEIKRVFFSWFSPLKIALFVKSTTEQISEHFVPFSVSSFLGQKNVHTNLFYFFNFLNV